MQSSRIFKFIEFHILYLLIIFYCGSEPSDGALLSYDDLNSFNIFEMYASTPRKKSINCSCGRKNHIRSNNPPYRKSYYEYPWQVLIFRTDDGNLPLPNVMVHDHCGGSIINDRMILTSANCIWDPGFDPYDSDHIKNLFFETNLTVKFNSSRLKVVLIDGQHNVEDLEVDEVAYISHFAFEKFVGRDLDWDVGLIKLKKPLTFSDQSNYGLRPVCLPSGDINSLTGQTAAVVMWSYSEGGMNPPNASFHFPELLLNSTFIYGFDQCRINTWNRLLSTRFLCMETKRIHEATHKGYPVLIHTRQSQDTFFQVGVTSWTSVYGSARNKPPSDVFSNLASFIETKANEWGGEWCMREPKLDLRQASNDFDGNFLTSRKRTQHPWIGFTSGSRSELITCRCGIPKQGMLLNPKPNGRIPLSFSWHVRIVINRTGTEQLCGGSLVNDRVIISSARCFYDSENDVRDEAENIFVYLNCDENYSNYRESCDKQMKVHLLVRFPDYDEGEVQSDVAILVLEQELDFQSLRNKITPVCLPKTFMKVKLDGRDDAIVTRWKSKTSREETMMKKLTATILNKTECQSLLHPIKDALKLNGWSAPYKIDFPERLCVWPASAEYINYDNVDYTGDPLVIPRFPFSSSKPMQYFQVGILAFQDFWKTLGDLARQNGKTVQSDLIIIEGYSDVQEYVPFIDYYSMYHGAKWCSW